MLISRDKGEKVNLLFVLEFLDVEDSDSGPFILLENGAPLKDENGKPIKTEE